MLAAAIATAAWPSHGSSTDGPKAVSQAHFVAEFSSAFLGIDDTDSQSFTGGGTYYAPFGDSLGLAIGGDAGFGAVDGDFGEAINLHAAGFWRDPELGYLGSALTFDHVTDFQRVNISAIGGLYAGDWDLAAAAGYDGGDGPGVGLFSFSAGWYLHESLRLGGDLQLGTNDTVAAAALAHWQPAHDSPVTLHAGIGGGEIGDEGFYSVTIGLTVSFGPRASLRRQLRADRLLIFE